jgi:hypothetical protein
MKARVSRGRVCFHPDVVAMPHGRRRGVWLLAIVPVLILLTLGLAFTIFGEVAALLALVSLVAGVILVARGSRVP